MIKFRLYYDKDKETKWINEMAEKGYAMAGFFAGVYIFEECRPGEYLYQIDITEGFFYVHSDYREFMNGAGVEIVCVWGPWVILRRKALEGPFELYTDTESRIEHYTKIRDKFQVMTILELVCLLMCVFGALMGGGAGAMGSLWLIMALVVVFVRQVIRLNELLAELKGRLGEMEWRGVRTRRVSWVLAVGMLVNGCSYLMEPVYGHQILNMRIAAVVLILAGVALTCRKRE